MRTTSFLLKHLKAAGWTMGLALSLHASVAQAAKNYAYSYLGNPQASVSASPVSRTPSIVLMGGGYDVGAAFRWMIQRAGIGPASGGRFVVIRATGTDAYNPYIYSQLGTTDTTTPMGYENVGGIDLGLTSVETLVIPSREAAEDPFVLDVVAKASAIWIAGGNQADYFNFWQATSLDKALQSALSRGIPVGGTSAGTAMLGEYAFVALNGGVTSGDALLDPFNKYMTLDPLNVSSKNFLVTSGFLSASTLPNTIAEPHFNTRDRMGRLTSFVARIGNGCTNGVENYNKVYGIGIDEETALLLSKDNSGNTLTKMVVNPYNATNFAQSAYTGANSAYFVKMAAIAAQCKANAPLAIANGGIAVYRMSDPTPRPPTGSAPYSSYLTDNTLYLNQWLGSSLPNGSSLGKNITGPDYYGAGNGTVIRSGTTAY